MKTETATLSYKIKQESKLLKYMLNLLNYALKVFVGCSIFFLLLSIFTFNLEIQEFNGNYTQVQHRTCIIQQATLLETLYSYFNEI